MIRLVITRRYKVMFGEVFWYVLGRMETRSKPGKMIRHRGNVRWLVVRSSSVRTIPYLTRGGASTGYSGRTERSIGEIRSHLDNDFPEVLGGGESFERLGSLVEREDSINLWFDGMMLDESNKVLEVGPRADVDSMQGCVSGKEREEARLRWPESS